MAIYLPILTALLAGASLVAGATTLAVAAATTTVILLVALRWGRYVEKFVHSPNEEVLLLKVLGLYPPGTFVELANGEMGVVVARGAKAHTPVVAALRRADGSLMAHPMRRDTQQRAHAVQRGLATRELKVRVQHLRVLSC